MAHRPYRGVFTIPVTPFTEAGALDTNGLQAVVEFCLAAGAHGLVAPVNASEFSALSDEERRHVVETVARVNDGRVPFVAGVSGVSHEVAVAFARHARDHGADAVIAMPPYVRKPHPEEIRIYYEKVADAAGLPLFIQNHPIGVPMSPAFLSRLARDIPAVRYIKEEIPPVTHAVSADLAACGDAIEGVFGGAAGRYIMDEWRRGAAGTMPACEVTDVHVAIWKRYASEDKAGARVLFNRLLPLLNFEALHSVNAYKEVLRRRGVIRSAYVRASETRPLDACDHAELDVLLTEIRDLFVV